MIESIDYILSHVITKLIIASLGFIGGILALLRFFLKINNIDELKDWVEGSFLDFTAILDKSYDRWSSFPKTLSIFLLSTTAKKILPLVITGVMIPVLLVMGVVALQKRIEVHTIVQLGALVPSTDYDPSFSKTIEQSIAMAVDIANDTRKMTDKKIAVPHMTQLKAFSAAEAVHSIQELIEANKISAIVNASSSLTALAIKPLLANNKITEVIAIATYPDLTESNGHIFRVCPSENVEIQALARYTSSLSKRLAVVSDQSEWSKRAKEVFEHEFTRGKSRIIKHIPYDSSARSVFGVIQEISSNAPDGVCILAFDPLILASIKQNFPRLQLFTSINPLSFRNSVPTKLLEGVIYAEADEFDLNKPTPAQGNFINAYRSRYKEDPDRFSAYAYDATTVLIRAIRRSKEFTGPEIAAELLTMKPFPGVMGTVKFDNRGELSSRQVIIKTIVDGKARALRNI